MIYSRRLLPFLLMLVLLPAVAMAQAVDEPNQVLNTISTTAVQNVSPTMQYVVEQINSGLRSGADLLSPSIVELLKEVRIYGIVNAIIGVCYWILGLALWWLSFRFFTAAKLSLKDSSFKADEREVLCVLETMGSVAFGVTGLIQVMNGFHTVKASVIAIGAPTVWVIQQLSRAM